MVMKHKAIYGHEAQGYECILFMSLYTFNNALHHPSKLARHIKGGAYLEQNSG